MEYSTSTTSTTFRNMKGNNVVLMPSAPEGAEETWAYIPVRYTGNDLPAVLPPTGDLTPAERKILRTQQAQKANEAATLAAYDKAGRRRQQGGIANKVKASVGPKWANIKTHPRPISEPIPTKREEKRFNKRFNFTRYEKLLYASKTCKVLTGNLQIIGKIYIGENFFCFRESKMQPRVGRRNPLTLVVPINNIAVLAKGVAMRNDHPGSVPEFRVLDSNTSTAEALFLYTNDGFVHRFCGFWTRDTFNDTFTVLDRQWRTFTCRPIGNPLESALLGLKDNQAVMSTAKPPTLPVGSGFTQSSTTTVTSLPVTSISTVTSSLPAGQSQVKPFLGDIQSFDNSQLRPVRASTRRATGYGSVLEEFRSSRKPILNPGTIAAGYLPSDLKDDIRFFNVTRLSHVEPKVSLWIPTVDDLRRRKTPLASTGVPRVTRGISNLSKGSVDISESVTPVQLPMASSGKSMLPASLINDIRSNALLGRNANFSRLDNRSGAFRLGKVLDRTVPYVRPQPILERKLSIETATISTVPVQAPTGFVEKKFAQEWAAEGRIVDSLGSISGKNVSFRTPSTYSTSSSLPTASLSQGGASSENLSVSNIGIQAPSNFKEASFADKWSKEQKIVEDLAVTGAKNLSTGTA